MRKLFIVSAFIISALANAKAQNPDSLSNEFSAIKIIGVKKPVYIVDGIKQSAYSDFKISRLKPENIQEIYILKGEEAIKLYGVEALEGAILITTKLGKGNLSNLELKTKLADLHLDNNLGSVRSIKLLPEISNQKDSTKATVQSQIIFRGLNNSQFNAKEPVYVLNGDKVGKDAVTLLNPELIESITVLKKESSTALYGVQGALNGVIIVTTKKVPKPIPKLENDIDKN
ncbi:TonB-dependent receptor plug domain-containing protein [Pedobacter jamesrossensis]|uniref:TonB-dependent receptor plug domain-containing protein n=1 Tax=Pedobacter jamesrossensis TaxID=1908238 RepID=A0ABV8NLZ7_9SPHI